LPDIIMSPMYAKQVLEFYDYDALLETVQGTSVNISLLKSAPYRGEITHTALENIWLDTSTNNTAAQSVGIVPEDRFLLGVNRKEMAPIRQAGATWTTQRPLFFTPGAEMDLLQLGGVDVQGLALDRDFFEQKIGALLEPETYPQLSSWRSLSPSGQTLRTLSTLLETILYFAEEGILQTLPPASVANLEEAVALTFADLWYSTSLNCQHPSRAKPVSLAWRVRNFMRDQASARLRLTDICAEFSISKRTLQYVFAKEYGISPMKYLQMIRLNRVYRQLLQADPQATTVTNVAMNSGFWHMGNFSGAYKQLFGESPSHTLQRTPSSYYMIH
jgi:AraC family ethanolamine operon transcriptional activator